MSEASRSVAGHGHRHVQPPSQSATLRYIPGLDGIRGLAVLDVVIDHTGLGLLPGGYVGVDVFFVLSGFLITRILVRRF
jgi:peptidoglycan/LPS O-acetylase OafA/YrhL